MVATCIVENEMITHETHQRTNTMAEKCFVPFVFKASYPAKALSVGANILQLILLDNLIVRPLRAR